MKAWIDIWRIAWCRKAWLRFIPWEWSSEDCSDWCSPITDLIIPRVDWILDWMNVGSVQEIVWWHPVNPAPKGNIDDPTQ